MRLLLLAAFAAALLIFGCSNLTDGPAETPATPSVQVAVATPSVEAPVTAPVTKTSTKHRKHRKHHHKHRLPAKQPEPTAEPANNPVVTQPQTPFEWNGCTGASFNAC
jgi:hypothetical protein